MIINLLVSLMLLVVTSTVFAEVKGPAYCKGMSLALELPDEKVFETFLIVEEQLALNTWGNSSEKYLKLVQERAYTQGYGAGLGHGIVTAEGKDFAFKFFMNNCYANDYALRKSRLDIEYPK